MFCGFYFEQTRRLFTDFAVISDLFFPYPALEIARLEIKD